MTAELIFQLANPFVLVGWLILAAAIVFKKPVWRDVVAGQVWPSVLAVLYTVLILFCWAKTPGGFDSLPNVQAVFTYSWAALAGWVHYLAFDLFVGSYVARRVEEEGLPRMSLLVLLPLTFMFGPIGYLAFQATRLLFGKVRVAS